MATESPLLDEFFTIKSLIVSAKPYSKTQIFDYTMRDS